MLTWLSVFLALSPFVVAWYSPPSRSLLRRSALQAKGSVWTPKVVNLPDTDLFEKHHYTMPLTEESIANMKAAEELGRWLPGAIGREMANAEAFLRACAMSCRPFRLLHVKGHLDESIRPISVRARNGSAVGMAYALPAGVRFPGTDSSILHIPADNYTSQRLQYALQCLSNGEDVCAVACPRFSTPDKEWMLMTLLQHMCTHQWPKHVYYSTNISILQFSWHDGRPRVSRADVINKLSYQPIDTDGAVGLEELDQINAKPVLTGMPRFLSIKKECSPGHALLFRTLMLHVDTADERRKYLLTPPPTRTEVLAIVTAHRYAVKNKLTKRRLPSMRVARERMKSVGPVPEVVFGPRDAYETRKAVVRDELLQFCKTLKDGFAAPMGLGMLTAPVAKKVRPWPWESPSQDGGDVDRWPWEDLLPWNAGDVFVGCEEVVIEEMFDHMHVMNDIQLRQLEKVA